MKYANMRKEAINNLDLRTLKNDLWEIDKQRASNRNWQTGRRLAGETLIIEAELKRRGNPLLPEEVFR